MSFLNLGRMNWFTIALGENQRPRTWTGRKELSRNRFNVVSVWEALGRVRRTRQFTTVQDNLVRFTEAAAGCPSLSEEEKTRILVNRLRGEVRD